MIHVTVSFNQSFNQLMKVIGQKDYPPLQTIYENKVVNLAYRILKDPSHILLPEYELLPSGRRYRASRCKSNRYKLSFLPTSIALINKQPALLKGAAFLKAK